MSSSSTKIPLPYKPAMFKRGLLIVLLPFLFGTAIILFLNHLWTSAASMVKVEQQQISFIEHLDLAFDRWADVSLVLVASTFESDPNFGERIHNGTKTLNREFIGLRKMSKKFHGRMQILPKLEQQFGKELQIFRDLPAYTEGADMMGKIERMPRLFSKTLAIRTEVKSLLLKQLDEIYELRARDDKQLQNLKLVAYGCMGANVILALLLVAVFSRSINARMRVLIDNATRLPRGEELKQHVAGNDELAYLDRAISDASSQLMAAAEHRRSIFGMVAHDMRSPLTAAQNFLQLLEEMEDNISEAAKAHLASAESCLSAILEHVQALLNVERAKSEKSSDGKYSDSQASIVKASIVSYEHVVSTPGSAGGSPASTTINSNNLKHVPFGVDSDPQLLSKSNLNLLAAIVRPQIFHQVLLLVLIPLLIQNCFLLDINHQLISMERLAKLSRKYSDIATYMRIVQMDLVRAAAAQGIFLITDNEKSRALALNAYKQANEGWEIISQLSKDDPDWLSINKRIKALRFQKTDEILRLKRTDPPDQIMEVLNRTGEIKFETDEGRILHEKFERLYNKNSELVEEMQAKQAKANEFLSQMLIWIIFGNLVMALGVLVLFTTSLNRRLQILVGNAAHLGRRKNLVQHIKGSDEFAYLDLILHQAKNQLDIASSQRAEMMVSLADGMRQPLQKAIAHLNQFSAEEGSALSERGRTQLQRAEGNISRVLKLVDDLLTMETLETGRIDLELSDCNIKAVADDAISTVSSLARMKGITLLNSCTDKFIKADRARIAQVLINFLSNAIKFSPQNTTITLSNLESNNVQRICVTDQGPGMDAETKARVFEKFFQAQTEEKKQGFGLGLAICSLIVDSHYGQLGVESEPGKGSTFWFEIPAQEQK